MLPVVILICLTGDIPVVPALPPPSDHDVPLRDRMLKRPGTTDRFAPKQDDFVSKRIYLYVN